MKTSRTNINHTPLIYKKVFNVYLLSLIDKQLYFSNKEIVIVNLKNVKTVLRLKRHVYTAINRKPIFMRHIQLIIHKTYVLMYKLYITVPKHLYTFKSIS